MTRPRPWGRIIAGAIAACLFVLGAWSFTDYVSLRRACFAARDAEPIRLTLDLSQPDVYTGEFDQTHSFTCQELLYIETEPALKTPQECLALLRGLEGNLYIEDSDGSTVYEQELSADTFAAEPTVDDGDRVVPALRFTPFRTGTYSLRLEIVHGAPNVADIPHALVGQYELCGIEYMGAALVGLISLSCFVIGIIITSIIVFVTRRERLNRTAQEQARPADTGWIKP